MVEFGGFQGFGRVTDAALQAESAAVRVILKMARFASRGETRQSGQAVGVQVTGRAGGLSMAVCEGKGGAGVVEVREAVMPIMAGQAVAAKVLKMDRSEGRIQFPMAIYAGLLIESRNALGMAVAAGEGDAGGKGAVRSEGEAGHLVGKKAVSITVSAAEGPACSVWQD